MLIKELIYLSTCVGLALLADTYSIGWSRFGLTNQDSYCCSHSCEPGCVLAARASCRSDNAVSDDFFYLSGCNPVDPFHPGNVAMYCCEECVRMCDADGDEDVDLEDFGMCAAAYTGPL